MKKLIPKSVFAGRKTPKTDTLADRHSSDGSTNKNDLPLLKRAENAFEAGRKRRARRARNTNYVFIDQWSDWVKDEHGNWVRERERVAKRTGGVALQNNHLIKIVHALTGLWAKQGAIPAVFAADPTGNMDEEVDMINAALQENWSNNDMDDMLISQIEEAIIGGLAVDLEDWCANDTGEEDAYSFSVEPGHFFFESAGVDPLHRDIELIGHFEDYEIGALAAKIAHSAYDIQQLRHIYHFDETGSQYYDSGRADYQGDQLKDPEWFNPRSKQCRVYHIWTHEYRMEYRVKDLMDMTQPVYRIKAEQLDIVRAENAARLMQGRAAGMPDEEIPLITWGSNAECDNEEPVYTGYWHYQMLSPYGDVLEEYDSPYEHGKHPYVIKAYEYFNGDIIPLISSVIDQQRYINRLVTMFDLAIQASAKGVTLVPKSIVPKKMTEAEFARSCREFGGYIFYDDKNGRNQAKPEVIQSNTNMVGITEMLQLQLGFIPEITSVSDALQGKSPGSNVAASRYAMETQNSTTSVTALLEKFSTFVRDVAKKKVLVMQQYKQDSMSVVRDEMGNVRQVPYIRSRVKDLKTKVVVEMSPRNPVYRMGINQLVSEMWQQGALDVQSMLQASYIPGSSNLKNILMDAAQRMQANAEAMQQRGGVMPQEQPQGGGKRPYVRGESSNTADLTKVL